MSSNQRGGRGGNRGEHRGGGRGGGRGGHEGRGGGGAGAGGERPKKENILDLGKYMDKKITVKFTGGREGEFLLHSGRWVQGGEIVEERSSREWMIIKRSWGKSC